MGSMNDLSLWNPMKEDYYSEHNTYDNGISLHSNECDNNEHELFISGIPLQITTNGILNLLSNEGNISPTIRLWPHKEYQLAVVQAVTYKDALQIIEKFNGFYIGNYKLSIRFSDNNKKNSKSNGFKQKTEDMVSEVKTAGRGRALSMLKVVQEMRRPGENNLRTLGDNNVTEENNLKTSTDDYSADAVKDAVDDSLEKQSDNDNDKLSSKMVNKDKKIRKEVFKECILCKKPGNKRCTKCKAYYCSKACQINDWKRHKLYCSKQISLVNDNFDIHGFIPNDLIKNSLDNNYDENDDNDDLKLALNKVNKTSSDLRQSYLHLNEHCQAAISSDIVSPDEIYIISINRGELLENFTNEMTKYYNMSNQGNMVETMVTGCLYACEYNVDKRWYRAELISWEDHCGVVRFLDYGNVEKIEEEKFAVLDHQFVQMPLFAIKCNICDIKPPKNELSWSEDAKKYLRELLPSLKIVEVCCKYVDEEKQCSYVTLCDLDKNTDISDCLVKRELAVFCTLEEHLSWYKKALNNFYSVEYDLGLCEICITYINHPNDFYLINFSPKHKLQFKELHQNLEMMPKHDNIVPVIGDLIVASYQDKLYRASVIDLVEKDNVVQFKVFFVDFGNESFIKKSDVKSRLTDGPLELSVIPGFAHNACLVNSHGEVNFLWSSHQSCYFKNNYEVKVFKVAELSGCKNGKIKIKLVNENNVSLFEHLMSNI